MVTAASDIRAALPHAIAARNRPCVFERRRFGLGSIGELIQRLGGLKLKDRMGLVAAPDISLEVVRFRLFYIGGAAERLAEAGALYNSFPLIMMMTFCAYSPNI